LLPRWFPFNLAKVAYWSRTVIVPLLVLMTLKPQARNPRNIRLDELFVNPPDTVKDWNTNDTQSILNPIFRMVRAIRNLRILRISIMMVFSTILAHVPQPQRVPTSVVRSQL